MTKTPTCDDKTRLVAYLYGEGTPDERRAVEAHLADCAACRAEIEGLRNLRVQLAEWTPPEEVLGFRVVRGDAPAAPAPRAWWRAPAWGLAAAAVLVLAAGAAIARVEVRYDAQGFIVRTGWGAGAPAPAAATPAPAAVLAPAGTPAGAPWRDDLRALEVALRRDLAPAPVPATTTSDSGATLLTEVRDLIEASETRQQRELALRFAQLVRDIDQQRRADWDLIQAGFGRVEGLAGAGVVQQREMLNYVMRVSGRER